MKQKLVRVSRDVHQLVVEHAQRTGKDQRRILDWVIPLGLMVLDSADQKRHEFIRDHMEALDAR